MILNFFYKIANRARIIVFNLMGIKTVGARALVVKEDEVLLVKHTYQKGWYTIGGGVKRNESPQDAIVREVLEEAGVVVLEKPELFALYHNKKQKRDDYVAFYIIRNFEIAENSHSLEILEKKWFSVKNLPQDITPSTRNRIEEFLGQREKPDLW